VDLQGGSVYIVADRNVVDLAFETRTFNAGDGSHGSSANMTGRSGRDIIVRVPIGTIVTDVSSEDDHNYGHSSSQEVLWADDDENNNEVESQLDDADELPNADKEQEELIEFKEVTQEELDALDASSNKSSRDPNAQVTVVGVVSSP
jgi:GTPase involved in cell partitioning and DNA repair